MSLRYLPHVYYQLGKAQEAVGGLEAARASYRAFLKTRENADPTDRLALDARKRLASR